MYALNIFFFLFLIWGGRSSNIWSPGPTEVDYFTHLNRENSVFFSLPASKFNSRVFTLEEGQRRGIWESDHIRPAFHILVLACRKRGKESFELEDRREEFCIERKCNFEHLNETILLTHYVGRLWNLAKGTTVLQEKNGGWFH